MTHIKDSPYDYRDGLPILANGRIASIDGLHFIATLVIAFFYYYTHLGGNVAEYPFFHPLGVLYTHGYLAVEVFFILSGFKMAALYQNKVINKAIPFAPFMKKRLITIWPLLVATTLITEILQLALHQNCGFYFLHESSTLYDFIMNLFGINSAVALNVQTINGPAWTIPLNVVAYVCFYLVMRHAQDDSCATAFSIIALLAGVAIQSGNFWYPIINGNVARAIISFFIGVLLYEFQKKQTTSAKRTLVCVASLLILVVSIFALRNWCDTYVGNIDGYFTFVVVPCLLLLALNSFVAIKLFSCRLMQLGAKWSYSMYLIHFPVSVAIAAVFALGGVPIDTTSANFFALRAAIIFVATVITYYLIEKPIGSVLSKKQKWRDL